MATNSGDVLALLRRVLLRSTTTHAKLGGKTLNAAVGGRVQGPTLIDSVAATIPRPLVVIDVASGSSESSDAKATMTVYVYAYDDDGLGKAIDLYEAVHDVLQEARLHDPTGEISLAGSAREVGRPDNGHHSGMKTWYARGSWSVTVA